MVAEKMWLKSHRIYPPEIIQTTWLGRLQKKILEHDDCLYVVSILQQRVRKPQTPIFIVCDITFKQIVEVLIVIPILLKSIGTIQGQFVRM